MSIIYFLIEFSFFGFILYTGIVIGKEINKREKIIFSDQIRTKGNRNNISYK